MMSIETKGELASTNRKMETWAFFIGIALLTINGLAETFVRVRCRINECRVFEGEFPWWLLVTAGLLIAPKMIGRSAAGRFWNALPDMILRIRGRGPAQAEVSVTDPEGDTHIVKTASIDAPEDRPRA